MKNAQISKAITIMLVAIGFGFSATSYASIEYNCDSVCVSNNSDPSTSGMVPSTIGGNKVFNGSTAQGPGGQGNPAGGGGGATQEPVSYAYNLVHKFTGSFRDEDGLYPSGRPVFANDGYIYGITMDGGKKTENLDMPTAQSTGGVVWRVRPDGSNFSKIHELMDAHRDAIGGSDGYALNISDDGLIYTMGRRKTALGEYETTIIKMNKDGSGVTELHAFNKDVRLNGELLVNVQTKKVFGVVSGHKSSGPYTQDTGGYAWVMDSDGANFQKLVNFNDLDPSSLGVGSGKSPSAKLVAASGGYLYGINSMPRGYALDTRGSGSLWKIKADGSDFQVLKVFGDMFYPEFPVSDGITPVNRGGVLWGTDGYMYGTTESGGANNKGVIWKIKQDGSDYQVILNIATPLEQQSSSGIAFERGQYIYGVFRNGGDSTIGSIWRVKKDGTDFSNIIEFPLWIPTGGHGLLPYAMTVNQQNGKMYVYSQGQDAISSVGLLYEVSPQY